MATIRKLVPNELDEWGKVQRIGGDMMHARQLVRFDPDLDRDASFVRVCPYSLCLIFSLKLVRSTLY